MDDPDKLAEFLTRFHIPGQPPMNPEQARAAAGDIIALANASDDELAEQGYRWLTVVHGDLDSPEAVDAWQQLARWPDRHPGAVRQTRGTNDTTSWLLAPPNAGAHQAALEAVAQEHNPGWWQIRRTSR